MIYTIASQKTEPINIDTKKDFINTPKSIYKKMFKTLINDEIANVIINTKGKNGEYYWVFIAYSKKNNKVSTVFSEILTDVEKLEQTKSLYQKLNTIEKNASVTAAEKYLEGYLEYKRVPLNDLVSYYSLTA